MGQEASVSVRDEKQAVSASDVHAYCTCGADLGAVEMLVGADRIHETADVRQTIVLERPERLPAA